MIRPINIKAETIENHQHGIEGLSAAVIELAVDDLKQWNTHTQSAVYFFKRAPKLLEFWLSAATYQGRGQLNLEVAKQQLYRKACEAEQKLLVARQKKTAAAQLAKQQASHQR